MSLLKKMIEKLTQGYFYVVDINVLKEFLNDELKFTLENNLEASSHLKLYYKGEKHTIQVWNHAASNFADEKAKGLIVYYDDIEYKSIEELFENAIISNIKLKDIKDYFKIELIDSDSVFLNEYKDQHPELNVEDYN